MNSETLKTIYNRNNWRHFLNELFGVNFKAFGHVEDLQVENQTAKTAIQLGEITLASGDVLAVYEVQLQEHIQVERNKVAIRNLLRTHWNKYDGAFIASYKDSEAVWRFSFVSETRQFDTDGNYSKVITAAKRFTYVLGKNESVRTATERFKKLGEIGKNATLEDIKTAFSVEALTKDFYKELFAWYQWALSDDEGFAVTFPNDTSTDTDDRKIEEHLIRLITRLMFVWFIKQKKLVPDPIFKVETLKDILSEFEPLSAKKGNYYNAILQNLFFATLNKKISEREFAKNGSFNEQKEHFGIKTLFRDANEKSWFKQNHKQIVDLFNEVPFMNGGLFECLDKTEDGKIMYYDGFSRAAGRQKRAFLPNCLFFDAEKGIIPLLEKYNFTVEENTPEDVEVALDPELLGKVFENLLGAYNPETKETARKQSGSFYTPREIVNYMVDESIIAYLKNACNDISEENIRTLFRMDILPEEIPLSDENKERLIAALKAVKMLDPACGSGAFPMGMLNRMLDLLHKLSPSDSSKYQTKLHLIENCIYGIDIQTIAVQISKLRFFISLICEQEKDINQDNYGIIALPNLETKFVAANTLIGLKKDFSDKLDLQNEELNALKTQLLDVRHKHFLAPSAYEKHKLRELDKDLRKRIKTFLIDNSTKPNTEKIKLFRARMAELEKEKKQYIGEKWEDSTLAPQLQATIDFGFDPAPEVQPTIFRVDVNKQKRNEIETQIKRLESEIIREESKSNNADFEDEAEKLAHWNPYDQNTSSKFFDAEWMFGVTGGFDLVVGNPPYINVEKLDDDLKKYMFDNFATCQGRTDIYVAFIEKTLELLQNNGINTFIIPYAFTNQNYAEQSREMLINKYSVVEIVDTSNYYVFDSASVKNVILRIKKAKDGIYTKIKIADSPECFVNNKFKINLIETRKFSLLKNCRLETKEFDKLLELKSKIEKKSISLENICLIAYGVRVNHKNDTNRPKSFYVHDYESKNFKLFVEGKNIERYYYSQAGWLNYCPSEHYNSMFPELFENEKIMFINVVSGRLRFTYDNKKAYNSHTVINCVKIDSITTVKHISAKRSIENGDLELSKKYNMKFILGILNSNLINWYFIQFQSEGMHFYPDDAKNLPIIKVSIENQSKIIILVDEILKNKNKLNSDTLILEHQIDELVFKLYNLTYKEVLVVCPDFWLSEEEYERVKIE